MIELQNEPNTPGYQYHQDFRRLSSTMLKQFLDSRQVFHAIYIAKTMPTITPNKVMDRGSVVHGVFLEDKPLNEFVAEYPSHVLSIDGKLVSKRVEAWKEKYDGPAEYFMKSHEIEEVQRIVDAVKSHAVAEWMLHPSCVRERNIFWTDERTGIECRAKPDFLLELKSKVLAFDLKVSNNYTPQAFSNYLCGNRRGGMRGWAQATHYCAGIASQYSKPVELRFVVVNPEYPHQIGVHCLAPHTVEECEKQYRVAMSQLAYCYETGDWLDDWQKHDNHVVMSEWEIV